MANIVLWMRGFVLAAFVTLGAMGATSAAQAASFDCARATTPTEKAICRDPVVSRLDDQVAAAFKIASAVWSAGSWTTVLRNDQREWLKTRNFECKADISCLK